MPNKSLSVLLSIYSKTLLITKSMEGPFFVYIEYGKEYY